MSWSGVILLVACSCVAACCKFCHFLREAEEDWYESARHLNIPKGQDPNEKQIRIFNDPGLQNDIFGQMKQQKVCSGKQSQIDIKYIQFILISFDALNRGFRFASILHFCNAKLTIIISTWSPVCRTPRIPSEFDENHRDLDLYFWGKTACSMDRQPIWFLSAGVLLSFFRFSF